MGSLVGFVDGSDVGSAVGFVVGSSVGSAVGSLVGEEVGASEEHSMVKFNLPMVPALALMFTKMSCPKTKLFTSRTPLLSSSVASVASLISNAINDEILKSVLLASIDMCPLNLFI